MRPCPIPLTMLLLVAGTGSATAEPFCRTVLNDGRVLVSEPFREADGLTCPSIAVVPRSQRGSPVPSMSFTTGPIGPFTTGNLPPVTTGNFPPLTTFSNSQPAASPRR